MGIFQLRKRIVHTLAKTLILVLGIIIIVSFVKPEKNYKLLIYVSFEDSLRLQTGDTNQINRISCLKLRVDTFEIGELVKDKSENMSPQPNNWYIYKGHFMLIHPKDQIFELSEYRTLKNYELTQFDMLLIGDWDRSSTSYSNCLTEDQKKSIKESWKKLKSEPKGTQVQFMLCLFKVVNKVTKHTLDFPGLTFRIVKR